MSEPQSLTATDLQMRLYTPAAEIFARLLEQGMSAFGAASHIHHSALNETARRMLKEWPIWTRAFAAYPPADEASSEFVKLFRAKYRRIVGLA